MNKYIDTDKLKAEIERYEASAQSAYNPHDEDADFFYGKVIACEDLLCILDTLLEQPVEGLEEAAGEYAVDNAQYYYEDDGDAICSTADILKPAFIAGAEWQKAKMMKEAVEGEICILPAGIAYVKEKNNETLKQYLLDNFKNGDKVRIIIVNEDKE